MVGFFFSWKPFIFMILVVLGGCYFLVINTFLKKVRHTPDEWEDMFCNEYK